jgi:glycerophosphoryl diester phosphodiesterase
MAIRLYAHRGAASECPENTLVSFHRAIEHGADALEMDVHLTLDGHVVVAHDPDGARMCDVARPVRHSRLVDLEGWDAGWGFAGADGARPYQRKGHRIPTLEQVLRDFPDRVLNIDIKQWSPPMVEPLVALLRRHGAEERVILASFRLRTLLAVRALGYRGPTSLPPVEVVAMLASPASLWRQLPWTGDAAQLPLAAGPVRFDTRRVIDRCHEHGLRVDYWTVNDVATAERLIDLGADGIMTDDPRALGPLFQARAS